MKNKIKTADEAVAGIQNGASVMIGGFMACGSPEILIDALVRKNVKHLTVICNDAGVPGRGTGKLLSNGQIDTLIASHVGLNPEVAQRMNTSVEEDRLECILVPQGTLAEQIRAAGGGLGGFLTPTGVGTMVAAGKKVINVDGIDYLLEKPLKADVALIRGSVTDEFGNTTYNGSHRDVDIVNAGAQYVSINEGAMFFDSAMSFDIIRGGHVDATILGALEVDQHGNIANWIVPGKMVPGMGGAMDLVVGARKVIIAMLHTQKGKHKILKECTLPYTALGVVDMIITEMGVMEVSGKGIVLKELHPDFSVEDVMTATGCELLVYEDLKMMIE